jgi:stearoyl-CoA desaturase (delta-9 desaturase)
MVGRQTYSREHSARDSALMAVLAFGEGYHNYHHSFPYDYRNGVKPWHFDPAKWMIYLFSRVGLARDLRRTPQALILKAKVELQFERAKERLSRAVHDLRHHYETRLHETHAKLQGALHDLLALQRRQESRGEPGGEHHSLEERLTAAIRSVEHAWREWKELVSATHRLPAVA